ncbi:MAG: EAL domain-containing protein, partial [Bacilli bacterium]|nr:EAL domain-containing protein [Bacilli bacterium]
SIAEKHTVSAEALLRVTAEPFHSISPDIYIPIAEKTGLIREIGLFVFEEVCKFLADERTKDTDIRYVELNLSTYQFLDNNLVEEFEAIRQKYQVPTSKINLEITETGGFLSKDDALEILEKFKALGYTLSLDDFGTGYSNFVRVVRCKFENIKIDKSLLWDLHEERNGHQALKSLTSFIKVQGASIIQEGVETKEQLELSAACGADYIQGFYFSKAIPVDDFYHYLATENFQ